MLQKMKSKKSPDATDKIVGARVRQRRMMLDMSQSDLADSLDLSFQMIGKYEKGSRISVSRLQQISRVLQVQVAWFFEGLPSEIADAKDALKPNYVSPSIGAEFLATRDGLALATAFQDVRHPALRRRIVDLVEQIVAASPKG